MAKLHTMARSALLRMLLVAVAVIACAGAIAIASNASAFADPASSDYEGGTIPILRVDFADDVNPDTGKVTLSGDEKLRKVVESADHSYKATGVSLSLEVPAAYDNPESGLWDGASEYVGESNLELEFIRGRGNSSWRVEKKPFKLKLDEKANLFGMGSNRHWVLLANYYDASLSLDRITLPEPESFSFPDSIELESGEYKQLDWTISPSPNALNESFNLFFLVDDEDIATCSEAGVVTGKSPGTTKVKMIRENPRTEQEEVVAEVTIIVKEDAAETFSIVFKLNGGSINGSTDDIVEEHEAGEVITMPDAPERDGYLFAYWKGSRYLPGEEYKVTGDHTFTAQWEKEGAEDGDDSGSGAKTISGNASSTNVKSSGSNGSNGSSTGSGTMTKTGDMHRVLVVLTGVVFVIAVVICGLALTRTLRNRRR